MPRIDQWACAQLGGPTPTTSSEQAPAAEPALHQHRQVAESFGTDPERYDRARPRYPEALVTRIVATGPGPDVIDVGCGTGIVARQFQAAGCKVLGIEPDARMAEFARRHGLKVELATFEAWDPAGRQFDMIVSGQTWHWLDPVAGAAKAAHALRPDGRLAVFWNVDRPPPDLVDAFASVYRMVMPDSLAAGLWKSNSVDAYSMLSERAADGMRQAGAFCAPEQWQVEWERTYTRDEWLDQLPTQGDHSRFPPAKLQAVLTGIGAAIDAVGGSFTMRYIAMVVTAARTGAT